MNKLITLLALLIFGVTSLYSLEPIAVSIVKTNGTAPFAITVELNDYSNGSANNIFPNTSVGSLTPNSSGVISFVVDGASWLAITASNVNSYYILDVKVDGTLYAQYRLDELVVLQSAANIEAVKTYSVGDIAQGGYVFYVTPNGKHGLVCQQTDVSFPMILFDAIYNANDPDFLDDMGDNYLDWRVPTIRELEMLYNNRVSIGGFSTGDYRSSSQYIRFVSGLRLSGNDAVEMQIRYVRTF